MDGNGRVKLADFGISTCILNAGDQQQSRSSLLRSCYWCALFTFSLISSIVFVNIIEFL